jgi:hypothetical protein
LFQIGKAEDTADTLLIEVGQDHCLYAFVDHPLKSFTYLHYISFSETEAEQSMAGVLAGIPGRNWKEVILSTAFEQSLLIPKKYFSGDHALLDAIYDVPDLEYRHDTIGEWQIVNEYGLPAGIFSQVQEKFPNTRLIHVYTPALKIYNGFVAADQVDIHFTTQYFRVLVKKDKDIQLAQTYSYKTPLDVVYYLLKICYEFNLDQRELFLIVSGLIDKDSALYEELHHYFLNLHFSNAPTWIVPEHDLPHYYFHSLYNLASCVS